MWLVTAGRPCTDDIGPCSPSSICAGITSPTLGSSFIWESYHFTIDVFPTINPITVYALLM
nr:MAG TPA: hypothetical protein [Caudoviricetes sp.]